MDTINNAPAEKCLEHPLFTLDFLYLDQNVHSHLICQECKDEKLIDDNQVLSVSDLLDCDEDFFFPNYPVLQDYDVLDKIKYLQQEDIPEQINYLKKQVRKYEKKYSMNEAMLSHKEALQKMLCVLEKSKQTYREISRIKELQALIISQEKTKGDKLHKLITKHLQESESYQQRFENVNIELEGMKEQIQELEQNIDQEFEKKVLIPTPQQEFELNLKNQPQNEAISFFSQNLAQIKEFDSISLDFSSKNIDDEKVLPLVQVLTQLVQLKSLDLNLSQEYKSKISIGEKGIKSLVSGIAQLKQLTHLNLNLGRNKIQDKGIEYLSQVLSQLQHLVSLNLDVWNNYIEEKGAKSLTKAIFQLKQLTCLQLNLGANNLNDDGVESLCFVISQLKHLTTLELNLEQTFNSQAKSLPQMFLQLNKLSNLSLNIWNNLIDDQTAIQLFKNISQLNQLKSLKLKVSYNPIGDKGIEYLFQGLRKLSLLKLLHLDLENNEVSQAVGISILSFLKEVSGFENIQLLLDGNDIEQSTLDQIYKFNTEEEEED